MLNILEGITHVVRFGLEMVTIFVLIVGGLTKGEGIEKVIFPILGVLVIVFWGMFVAPKAAFPQGPWVKLLVELAVFTVGTIGAYQLYDARFARIYGIIAAIDLALVYLFKFINPNSNF